jgi:hypothetical protein
MKKCFMNSTIRSIFILLFLVFSCSAPAQSSFLIGLTREDKVVAPFGSRWIGHDRGLPKDYHGRLLHVSREYIILATDKYGLFILVKGSNRWKEINSTVFRVRTSYHSSRKYRPVSAITTDMRDSNRIVIATKHTLYETLDRGRTWKKWGIPLSHKKYITSLALNGKKLVVGTSYSGVFFIDGRRSKNRSHGLQGVSYSKKYFFFEPIASIHFTSESSHTLTVVQPFIKKRFYYDDRKHRWKQRNNITKFQSVHYRNNRLITYDNFKVNKNEELKENPLQKKFPGNIRSIVYINERGFGSISSLIVPPKKISQKKEIRALYVSAYALKNKLTRVISDVKRSGSNAIVVDMKDDNGNIHFPTKNKTAIKINAVRKTLNIKKVLKTLHKNKIYVIARFVVFKDKKLYHALGNRYAIKNRRTGKAWKGTEHEYWVDPHSTFVHRYNISMTKELEKLGFDEIQYDYFRFPTDGPIYLCNFSYMKDRETYRSEPLLDMLEQTKKVLSIPLSVDVYGFHTWFYSGNYIGQDITEFARIVDAVSPMVYPSHFGSRFYKKGPRKNRPYLIVRDGCKRGHYLTDGKTELRPYLQAFNLMSPTFGSGYIRLQKKGNHDGHCRSYIFWNAKSQYDTVVKALKK